MSVASARRIDWGQVRALVRAYIVMSLRAMPLRSLRDKGATNNQGTLILVVGLYAVLGLLMGMVGTAIKDMFVYSFVLHMTTMFVVGTSAMNEASEVLFLSKENDVLLHRPIHPATLVLSKSITIVAFTSLLAAAINFVPTLALLMLEDAHPWAPLVHVVSVSLATVFASASVVCLFGLVARLLGRERFQRVITAAQIASTVFLVVGFQIVPRLVDGRHGAELGSFVHSSTTAWFLPPSWFAALDTRFGSLGADARSGALALVGLVATAAVTWLAVLRLPTLSVNVAQIQEEPRADVVTPKKSVAGGGGWIERLLSPWLRDPIQRASFRLARAYLTRERTIKVRLASALSVFVMLPVISMMSPTGSSALQIVLFWTLAIVPFTVVEALRVSTHPAAADLFLFSPIANGAQLFHGVRKAAIVFVQLPLAIYVGLLSAWVMRDDPSRLLLALPALIVLPSFSLVPGLLGDFLPLSMGARSGQRTAQGLLVFAAMIPAGVLGLVAHFAQGQGFLWVMLAIELPAAVALHFVLLHYIARTAVAPTRRAESMA